MNASFFQANRARLGEKLKGGLVVLSAYNRLQRSGDMAFAFEQEANFWYLTGVDEPDWKIVYDGTTHKSWLIMPEVDEVHRIFDGVLSMQEAKECSGVDEVLASNELTGLYQRLSRKHSVVYTIHQPAHSEHFNFSLNPSLAAHSKQLDRYFGNVRSVNKELAQLRAIKQPAELTALRAAIKVTTDTLADIQRNMESYTHEYQLEADISHGFRRKGAKGHAYDPIVAAGINACTLHYCDNTAPIKSKQLVLVDVGARKNGYAADITRTYVRGKATQRQSEVHAALVNAQKQIIAMLGPGVSIEEYQKSVDQVMYDTLVSVGLKVGDEQETVRTYMPHAISHGLGIDPHDSLGGPRTFQAGMVLTVEPGIYIPKEKMGLRIEDDILITESGRTNLSGSLSTDL